MDMRLFKAKPKPLLLENLRLEEDPRDLPPSKESRPPKYGDKMKNVKRTLHLDIIYCTPDYRGNGLTERMVEEIYKIAPDGIVYSSLITGHKNKAMKRVSWNKLGMHRVPGRVPGKYLTNDPPYNAPFLKPLAWNPPPR